MPKHVSGAGDFRLRLIAHEVTEKETESKKGKAKINSEGRQTGIAWFNYAVITPVPVVGRVNVNTAPTRLLGSLPGITPELAKNIAKGTDSSGKSNLKPYQRLGDLFKVKGMSPDIFERCVNLLALDSSTFTVEVEAETVKVLRLDSKRDSSEKSRFRSNLGTDSITGSRRKRFIVELEKAKDGFCSVREIERYSP